MIERTCSCTVLFIAFGHRPTKTWYVASENFKSSGTWDNSCVFLSSTSVKTVEFPKVLRNESIYPNERCSYTEDWLSQLST